MKVTLPQKSVFPIAKENIYVFRRALLKYKNSEWQCLAGTGFNKGLNYEQFQKGFSHVRITLFCASQGYNFSGTSSINDKNHTVTSFPYLLTCAPCRNGHIKQHGILRYGESVSSPYFCSWPSKYVWEDQFLTFS